MKNILIDEITCSVNMNNTMKPPAAAKYLTPSTPCSPPPYATIKNAIAPIETPHNIFCQRGGSSSCFDPSMHKDAMVVVIASADVANEIIKVSITTGTIIAPKGRFPKKVHKPDTAPFCFIVDIKLIFPLCCHLIAVDPHIPNHTKLKVIPN